MRHVAMLVLACVLAAVSGCAMLTGTVTGAFTGAVDAPAETYRANCETFHENPILFGIDAVVIGPIGIACGPLFGLGKGLSLDIQWCIGQVEYGDVFGTYGPASIWRPYTLSWPSTCDRKPCCEGAGRSHGEAARGKPASGEAK